MSRDLFWHRGATDRSARERQNGHRSAVAWFTGLSGAGKSTIAHGVEERLHALSCRSYVLDGDNVRHGLCADLGFSIADRHENIRRVGEVARLLVDAGLIVLTAFISPLKADRDRVRGMLGTGEFLEVYCHCPIEVCEERDVKGLYRRARAGEIPDFTGISSPYEPPTDAELTLDTHLLGVEESVDRVVALLRGRGVIRAER
jgi:adenylylsulfate kinase